MARRVAGHACALGDDNGQRGWRGTKAEASGSEGGREQRKEPKNGEKRLFLEILSAVSLSESGREREVCNGMLLSKYRIS